MDLELEKKTITKTIGTLSLFDDSECAKIENFENDFKRIKNKAKKEKYTNIKIELRCTCREYSDSVSSTIFAVVGDRLETNEEAIQRLNYSKARNQRHIEDIQRNYQAIERYKHIDNEYQKAIDKLS
jgi:phage-related tail protein